MYSGMPVPCIYRIGEEQRKVNPKKFDKNRDLSRSKEESEDSIRKQDRKEKREMSMIAISVITSAITAKIVATYYFKKIDGYVEEMCEITEKNNKLIQTILHKLYGSS